MEAQFRHAAYDGDLPTVQWILQQPGGVNVNEGTVLGLTALHFAVYSGHLAIVQAILQVEGVNVNVTAIPGTRTPLHWVRVDSSNARLMTQALLDAGADPNAADDDGETPLFRVARQNSPISVVEAMLDGGANPAAQNNNIDTLLHITCRYGHLDAVQVLIQRCGGPELECLTVRDAHELTPLDCLRFAQAPSLAKEEAAASIRRHILQCYGRMLAHRNGLLCVHSVLQATTFTALADDSNDEEFDFLWESCVQSTCRCFWNS